MLSLDVVRRAGEFRLNVRLDTGPGISVLVGPSGAGKSLTLRLVAGIERPDRGRVVLESATVVDTDAGIWVPPQARRVGMVFQDSLLLPHRSILDNVALAVRDGSRSRRRDEAMRWLEEVEGDDWAGRHPHQLSGGQAQRVALARALAGEPRVLLLDEPFNALDQPVRHRLRLLVRDLAHRRRIPTLFVTHDPAEAFILADEIHVLEHGAVTQSGSPEDIRLIPQTRYAADLAGANLLVGSASGGDVHVGSHVLHVADRETEGPVLVTIPAVAVSVHRSRPEGSPRNCWETTVDRLERLGDRVRLRTGPPLPITVEITRDAGDQLGLEAGTGVWVAVKATEIGVESDVRR
ncbi:MAG: ATP-binding cassette domain-containing protein [Acidimicrobiia bacterium]